MMMCTICREDICSPAPVTLSCGHSFHTDCIVQWLRNPNSMASCPNCRHVERPQEEEDPVIIPVNPNQTTNAIPTVSVARQMAAKYKRLKSVSRAIRSKANTFSKWDMNVKKLLQQHKTNLLQLRRQRRVFEAYRKSLMKKANIMVERQVWEFMKSSGHTKLCDTNTSIVLQLRTARKNLGRAQRNLLSSDHQAQLRE